MMEEKKKKSHFLVIGGGISGISCVEQLHLLCPDKKVTLITATDLVKSVVNLAQYGRNLEEFDVEEKNIESFCEGLRNVSVVKGVVKSFNPIGGIPKLIDSNNPYVIGIRDTSSVKALRKRLSEARRVAIIGNGGIALELVFELSGCEVLWAIKDDAIGNNFFDKGAATFLIPHLEKSKDVSSTETVVKRMKFGIVESEVKFPSQEVSSSQPKLCGGALGPDWSSGLSLHSNTESDSHRHVHIEYKCQVDAILSAQELKYHNLKETVFPKSKSTSSCCRQWPVYVKLTNGEMYGCDFVVSATGVVPNTAPFHSNANFILDEDGGIKVDENMRTNIPDVYAAGDVCTASWEPAKCWFQMRLWSQARPMGAFAAHCMMCHLEGQETHLDFCFELFAHVTKFFGFKVVLLGKFNAQGLGDDYQLLLRCTKGVEYVKVVLHNGRMVGAVLIGETDLEETFENLILNEIDLSEFGESLLDPRVDIDDFFD
ncbi:hypothetical protein QZH41_001132 [Actinostola sp. cb2023]|nr:hypothetical protein QZH41_001132 [Actinostola sp. cb2023]